MTTHCERCRALEAQILTTWAKVFPTVEWLDAETALRYMGAELESVTENRRRIAALETQYGELRQLAAECPLPRTFEEVQKAHDLLGCLMGLQEEVGSQAPGMLVAALDVLCWVLRHEHNPVFETVLSQLEAIAAERGIRP